MPGCYICGASIPRGTGLRRRLRTGTSVSGLALTSRPVFDWVLNSLMKKRIVGIRNTYALRTVCNGCARDIDDRRARQNNLIVGIAILALIGGIAAFVLFHLSLR
jgi:hypothetical protein